MEGLFTRLLVKMWVDLHAQHGLSKAWCRASCYNIIEGVTLGLIAEAGTKTYFYVKATQPICAVFM